MAAAHENETEKQICRAVGYVLAAIVIGFVTWGLLALTHPALAIVLFLILLAVGLWLGPHVCALRAALAPVRAAAQAHPHPAAHAQPHPAPAAPAPAPAMAPAPAPEPGHPAGHWSEAVAARSGTPATAPAPFAVHTGTLLAGETALGAEPGAWRYSAPVAAPEPAAVPEPRSPHWSEAVAARSGTPASAPASFTVRSGTLLGGETALATERGSWSYAAPAALSAPPAPEAESRPAGLAAAREGSADDLKDIKGVGPKLEILLHSLGVFHFDQIAAWTEAEIAWVDQNLEGFKGRVTRDAWVAQAKVLAAGRAKTGDVS